MSQAKRMAAAFTLVLALVMPGAERVWAEEGFFITTSVGGFAGLLYDGIRESIRADYFYNADQGFGVEVEHDNTWQGYFGTGENIACLVCLDWRRLYFGAGVSVPLSGSMGYLVGDGPVIPTLAIGWAPQIRLFGGSLCFTVECREYPWVIINLLSNALCSPRAWFYVLQVIAAEPYLALIAPVAAWVVTSDLSLKIGYTFKL
jgi:hypothetical protein